MGRLKTVMIAAVLLGGTAAAQAADLIAMPLSTGTAEVPVHDETGFDWDGFYAGVHGVGQVGSITGARFGTGLVAGASAQLDFVLVGGEVALQGLAGAGVIDTAYGQVLGRAGVVITDDVLLYAAAGYGLDLGNFSDDQFLLGGGVEVAVNDDLSVRAQYLRGVPLSGGQAIDQVTLGANFHF